MGVRAWWLLALAAVAACAERRPPPRPAPPAVAREPVRPPRWQPAPVVADGRPVPGGREHVVRAGHTGLAIARAYGVPWRRIAEANGIGPESILRIGQRLFIPAQPQNAGRGRPSAAELAANFTLDIDDLLSGTREAEPPPPGAPPPAAPGAPPPPARPASPAIPALVWPTEGRVILSSFGPKPGGRVNEGILIRATSGSPVRAAAAGTVLYVGEAIESFGLLVLLRHEGGVVTAYGHLEEALVARGEVVRQGDIIARAGRSGAVPETALMFQLRVGRKAVDPLPHLRRPA